MSTQEIVSIAASLVLVLGAIVGTTKYIAGVQFKADQQLQLQKEAAEARFADLNARHQEQLQLLLRASLGEDAEVRYGSASR